MNIEQRRLGPYELQQLLASHPTNEVWKAFDGQKRRYVSIKIWPINAQIDSDVISHFLQEGQELTALHHPHIAQVLDVQTSRQIETGQQEAYIVTEYIEGQSLADYMHSIAQTGQLSSPQEIVELLSFIGSALDYAHRRGIVHGHIKPSNIIFDRHHAGTSALGEPKLTDFGANAFPRPINIPLSEAYYVSPEIAQGQAATVQSDLYMLGIVLYELCTGKLPFEGNNASEVMLQHIRATPTAPASINPHILPALASVIMRSLAKDPAARFANASAMTVAVAKALDIPLHDVVSQSGTWLGISLQNAGSPQDTMNSPTYLSPLPSQQFPGAMPGPYGPSAHIATQGPPSTPIPAFTQGSQTLQASGTVPAVRAPGSGQQETPVPPATGGAFSSGAQRAVVPATQPPNYPYSPPAHSGRRTAAIILIAVAILVLLSGVLGTLLLNFNGGAAPQKELAGHAFFASSGQLNQNSAQGIADRLQTDLQGLPNPQTGKSYYIWLLSEQSNAVNALPILLGTVTNGGRANFTYAGDATHNDLLISYSRLLITEEDAGTPPSNPSLDPTTWRYYAEFSHAPNPLDTENHFSLLDHLRHLLAQDPKLKSVGLNGGLDIWLFRNTMKILEWAGSARDARNSGDINLARRQIVRILDYLDGSQYIGTENLPPDLQTLLVDPTIARVALLEFDVQNQQPPGYLRHIGIHLRELSTAPGVTPAQKQLAIRINEDINNVQFWLSAAHKDAEKLIHTPPDQLGRPEMLPVFDDLFNQANMAFVGQVDPNTNQVKEGVVQIHYNIQRLATFDIARCTASNQSQPCS